MNFNTIKNIIFDLGNVIINIDFDLTYQAFAKITNKNLEEVYNSFDKLDLWDKYEKGQLSNQEFINTLREALEITVDDKEIIAAWNALLLDIPQKRIDRILALKKKYRIFILSNTSDLHILDVNRILKETRGIENLRHLVEKLYYSYEMGMRKPSDEIYLSVLKDSNLAAEETLFLDDNFDNVIGARKIGIHAIHVTDKDLCDYLKEA